MKIVKSCLKQEVAATPTTLQTIPIGTIFRYNDLDCGPYLRLVYATLDLSTNEYTVDSGTVRLNSYVSLPNAYLVTGEK